MPLAATASDAMRKLPLGYEAITEDTSLDATQRRILVTTGAVSDVTITLEKPELLDGQEVFLLLETDGGKDLVVQSPDAATLISQTVTVVDGYVLVKSVGFRYVVVCEKLT